MENKKFGKFRGRELRVKKAVPAERRDRKENRRRDKVRYQLFTLNLYRRTTVNSREVKRTESMNLNSLAM